MVRKTEQGHEWARRRTKERIITPQWQHVAEHTNAHLHAETERERERVRSARLFFRSTVKSANAGNDENNENIIMLALGSCI